MADLHPLAPIRKILHSIEAENWVTRFAPSPTGFLHLGHLLHIYFVYGIARAVNAKVILRIEDHDQGRYRKEYEDAILQDLESLGLLAHSQWKPEELRQSNTPQVYSDMVGYLRAKGIHLYGCICSRKEILGRTGQEAGELRYDGFCRNRCIELQKGVAWRIQIEEAEIEFEDLLLGKQVSNPGKETGDLLIRDREGNWSYQFCVVVDDLRQGINLVIRGNDLLSSTARQIQLATLITGKEPGFHYLHHPLITDGSGRKLSKKDFDQDLHSMIKTGATSAELLGAALHQLGWQNEPKPMDLAEFVNFIMSR